MRMQASDPESTASQPRRFARVRALDGLRGLAIFAVLVHHADEPSAPGGFIGVDVFFVLSGFLITTLLAQEYDAGGRIDLRRFYMRRVLRLGPALGVLMLFYFVYVATLSQRPRGDLEDALIVLLYGTNWARAFHWHGPKILPHTWSLSVEEQFYMTWPLLLWLVLARTRDRWNALYITVGLSVASCLLRVLLLKIDAGVDRVYHGTDTRADALLLGCALALLLRQPGVIEPFAKRYQRQLDWAAVAALVGLGFFCLYADYESRMLQSLGLLVVEGSTLVIVTAAMSGGDGPLARVLSLPPLVWLGTVSYGLYLWHFPIYDVMRMHGASATSVQIYGTALAFVVTSASYYLVERPALRLKHRFESASTSVGALVRSAA